MTAMEPFDPINDGSHDDIEPVSVTTAPKLRLSRRYRHIGSRLAVSSVARSSAIAVYTPGWGSVHSAS